MAMKRRYIFNHKTLSFEVEKVSASGKLLKGAALLVASLLAAGLYFSIYLAFSGNVTPKQKILEHSNARLASKLDMASSRLDIYQDRLDILAERDNSVYRSIFGMEEIPYDVRDAGYGGTDRYERFRYYAGADDLTVTVKRLDMLNKKAYIQSLSLDEV